MNSWIRLVHRLLTVVIALHNGIRVISSDAIDHIHWGNKLDSQNLWNFYGVTFGQCHKECYVRPLCTGYNYHRLLRKCKLKSDDSATEMRRPGWIYSKKVDWTNKSPHSGCSGCTGVCSVDSGGVLLCTIDWCGAPTSLDPESDTEGNVYSLGSKVKHVCTDDPTVHVISTCLTSGNWSPELLECYTGAVCTTLPPVNGGTFQTPFGVAEGVIGTAVCHGGAILTESTATCLPTSLWNVTSFACWAPVGSELNNQNRKIFNQYLNKVWHNDGCCDKKISVRYQPNDQFVDYDFTYNADDSSYSLYDNDNFICDGYGTSHSSLHTRSDCPDTDRHRFFIFYDSSSSTYLIKSKKNGRVVRIDEDKIVSTKENLADDRAKFHITS